MIETSTSFPGGRNLARRSGAISRYRHAAVWVGSAVLVLSADALLTGHPSLGLQRWPEAILFVLSLGLAVVGIDRFAGEDAAGRFGRAPTGVAVGVVWVIVHYLAVFALRVGSGVAPTWSSLMLLVGGGLAGALVAGRPAFASLAGRVAAGMAMLSAIGLVRLAIDPHGGGHAPSLGGTAILGGCFIGSLGLLLSLRHDLRPPTPLDTVAEASFWGDAAFHKIAESLPIPIMVSLLESGAVQFGNQQARERFLLVGEPADWHTSSFYANGADQKRIVERLRTVGFVENVEMELRRSNGTLFWALVSARVVTLNGQRVIVSSSTDISDRKAADAALLDSEVRYALISRAANDGLWDWDIQTGVVFFSNRWKEIAGYSANDRLSTMEAWLDRVHPEDAEALQRDINRHLDGATSQLDTEYRIRCRDGHFAWMSCRGIALRDGGGTPIRMAGSQTDITLRKSYELTLRNAAYLDSLTGLNNRAHLTQIVGARSTPTEIAGSALMIINLDQFRRLNDSLGTVTGDAVLVGLAQRLTACAKPGDVVARLGNDEFVLWLASAADPTEARGEADRLFVKLSLPMIVGELEVPASISIGLATPEQGVARSGADLLRNARVALDRAKVLGGGRIESFDEALLKEIRLRQRLSKDLTTAHRLGQIFFDYQPIIDLSDNRIAGFEALMRWRHPELGSIPPGTFIPIAEDAGLIGQLGYFAIESAARQVKAWARDGLIQGEFSISVNLSARQISDRVGMGRLLALLDKLALPAGRLKLELTESVLMQDPEAMAQALQEFRNRGIALSLDDFGTGYSSLSYLHRFPLDVLKVDRSFVSRMCHAPEAYRLVRSIIELGHDLGLQVVGEGVEVAEEAASLKALGCDYAQGYFFSRPIAPDRAAAMLLEQLQPPTVSKASS